MKEYKPHPAAQCFPLIDGPEFDELVEDIRAHGLRHPIEVFENQILDGRNRERACKTAGRTPTYREVKTDDPVAYVISANMRRRHMDSAQRAAIAAELANIQVGDFLGNQHTGRGLSNDRPQKVSASEAAKQMNVGVATVQRAKKMKQEDPEMFEAARTGGKQAVRQVKQKRQQQTVKKELKVGSQKLARSVFTEDVTNSSDWFATHVKPLIASELGLSNSKEIPKWVAPEDIPNFLEATRRAHDKYLARTQPEALLKEAEETRAALAETQQAKLDRAMKAARRALEVEIQERVTKELNEILPMYNETHDRYQKFNNDYKGVMSRDRYRKLRSLLHSDKYQNLSDDQRKRMDDMFQWAQENEEVLCGLLESQKTTTSLPRTRAELMAMRKSRQH